MTAPAELVIEVTADDIRLGVTQDACRCPIARAVARLLKTDTESGDVIAGMYDLLACLPDDPTTTEYEMPDVAREFIDRFDDGNPVDPFTFTVRLRGEPS